MMPVGGSISNSRLHCGLAILVLFILVFLSIPLLLINISNSRYERLQSEKELNCVQYANRTSNDGHPVQCPSGYFPCNLCPDICVEQWKICDGNPDCPDRSDESSCHDSNGAMDHMFKRIVESTYLWNRNKTLLAPSVDANESNASQWRLAKPESCPMAKFISEQCPCNLTETNVVICDRQALRQIPRGLLASVFKIRMSDNALSNIDRVEWPRALSSLVLVNNQISHLGRSAFRSAPALAKLYLSHNNISYIDEEAFAGLHSLTWLLLESNLLTGFDTRALKHTPKIYKIHLSDNLIELDEETRFSEGREIKELLLDHNRITLVRAHYFSNMTRLIWLSLTHNQISYIEDSAFNWNYELQELNLSFNRIKAINRLMFHRRLNLQRLYLSGNPLSTLPRDAFDEIVELKSLNLSLIEFDAGLNKSTFDNLKQLEFIYFAKFRFCHFANHVRVCRPSTDGLSSLDELLLFPVLKYAVWIVALACGLGNVFVFVWRSISPYEDQTLSFYVKNLSIADLLMGIYLSVIGYFDMEWRHHFGKHAMDWMSSPGCATLGFLAILSSELSVFILTIITIERYRSITSIKQLGDETQRRRARLSVALAWLVAVCVASYLPIEWLRRQPDYYASNGLCLPLNINQPYSHGWEYSAFIYLGINLTAVLVMMVLYVHMYSMIMSSHQRARPFLFKTDKREDAILAFRFFFIVLTNCLCWIPIGVIKVYALFKPELRISSTIYSWLVIFIIPINSALNPLVYTLAAPTSLRAVVCRTFRRLYFRLDGLLWPLAEPRHQRHHEQQHQHQHGRRHRRQQQLGSASDASALSSSGYSSSTNNSLDAGQLGGRRRRKTGSSSTTTCDTLDTTLAGQPKASIGSALGAHEPAAAGLLLAAKDALEAGLERGELGAPRAGVGGCSVLLVALAGGGDKPCAEQADGQARGWRSVLARAEPTGDAEQWRCATAGAPTQADNIVESLLGSANNKERDKLALSAQQNAGAIQRRSVLEGAKFASALQSALDDRPMSAPSAKCATVESSRDCEQQQQQARDYRAGHLARRPSRPSSSCMAANLLLANDTPMAETRQLGDGGVTGCDCAPTDRPVLGGGGGGTLDARGQTRALDAVNWRDVLERADQADNKNFGAKHGDDHTSAPLQAGCCACARAERSGALARRSAGRAPAPERASLEQLGAGREQQAHAQQHYHSSSSSSSTPLLCQQPRSLDDTLSGPARIKHTTRVSFSSANGRA